MNLSAALSVFSENLDEIQDNIATNIKADLDALPALPTPTTSMHEWVQKKVRGIEVQEITTDRLKIIRRIQGRKMYFSASSITEDDKQRAKEVPITELYDGKLLHKKLGLCPFHTEATPSFHINLQKNTWRCYGCDAFGDSIDFVMKRDSIQFLDAVKHLIQKV